MAAEAYQAKYKTHREVRLHGAIGNLGDGPEIRTHGVAARLIAWPGNGYQTESVHVLTLRPGEASETYRYGIAEEAMICFKGRGEVFLRGRWVDVAAGDVAYFPEGVPHAIRNPADSGADFVLVTQITPPQFDLYIEAGFYHKKLAVLNFEAVEKATLNAGRANLSTVSELRYHDTHAEVRAWNLSAEQVRREGALFNVYKGAPFHGIGLPMRLVLWPGAGTRTAGFNYAYAGPSVPDIAHRHPVSDECLILWAGKGQAYMGQDWIDIEANDVILAPCGVIHGTRNVGPTFWGGFASPPQLDLLMNTDYYRDGFFLPAPFQELTKAECPGVEGLGKKWEQP